MIETPELNKMVAISEKSQAIGEFLDWLKGKYVIAQWLPATEWEPSRLVPTLRSNIENLLASYFEIDMEKVEKERRALLDEIRRENENKTDV